MNISNKRCCYAAPIKELLKENETQWLQLMQNAFAANLTLPLGNPQIGAWKDCFRVLKKQLPEIAEDYSKFNIVFEYILPYESGRRPDVVLVSHEQVIILEFKQKFTVYNADIDQTAAYARDIREYHYESRNKEISAILVITGGSGIPMDVDPETGTLICSGNDLGSVIKSIVSTGNTDEDITKWMDSNYEPLPTIVEAAKLFVKNEELPNIRRVSSTCIPQAIECLKNVSQYAKDNKKHVVAFVTGVPGAGKTFLGLQYVYDICKDYDNVNSVYLSGNGPLVAVLTEALHSGVFVKDLHKVVNQYLANGAPDFRNNIVVFDEGQRAWDQKQMSDKRNTSKSEPDVIMELCSKRLEWCVLLVLVGEGQEIHKGENAGISQWNTAIDNSGDKSWEIICPDKIASVFPNKKIIEDKNRASLNLSVSLRTHLAGDVSTFANAIVAGDIATAKDLSGNIKEQGFNMYITRNLDHAKRYLRQRYSGESTKRYGMIASSKGNILPQFGMDNSFNGALGLWTVGKWFNAEVDHPKSCCALDKTATEFHCQGLEIDMPLIGWSNDMLWDGEKWERYKKSEAYDSDVNTYRRNSYRVLLTRGRDGFVIFVPDTPEMNPVYDMLRSVGIERLELLQS